MCVNHQHQSQIDELKAQLQAANAKVAAYESQYGAIVVAGAGAGAIEPAQNGGSKSGRKHRSKGKHSKDRSRSRHRSSRSKSRSRRSRSKSKSRKGTDQKLLKDKEATHVRACSRVRVRTRVLW